MHDSSILSGLKTDSREDIVDADDAVRSGGAAVVDDGGVALYPDPAPMFGQHAIVLCGDLTFHQYCRKNKEKKNPSQT